MPDGEDREVQLARRAMLQGYRLDKAPADDSLDDGRGGYMLVDDDTQMVACGAGPNSYSADLDEIEQYLDEG